MHGLALMLLTVTPSLDPAELSRDATEVQSRDFAMPLTLDPDRRDTVKEIRLFVSEDRGKTWKHEKDYKPTDKRVLFSAPRDGVYWFAVQVVSKDGKKDPAELNDLTPAQKVYVNTQQTLPGRGTPPRNGNGSPRNRGNGP
jgi:hypothetical protein